MNSRCSILLLFVAIVFGQAALAQTNEIASPVINTNQIAVARPEENLSGPAREVVKLSDSNSDQQVVLAYVDNSPQPFDLTADNVIYLRDLGISSDVVTAMLERDTDLQKARDQVTSTEAPAAATAAPTNTVAVAPNVPTVAATAPAVPEVQPFYESLSPYGSWVNIPGEGWAWQPNVVVTQPGWQPYCDAGRWLWTDTGWYWASDYSWGWAPFHYGRWWLSPNWGWVWFPGSRWAPSWVTWRTYGDFCGWAPLPPHSIFVGAGFSFGNSFVGLDFDFGLGPDCFTFVDFPLFLQHDFHHHRLSHDRVNQFFNRSTVINHFTTTANNGVVINNGVPLDRVRRATRDPIRTVPVVESSWRQAGFHRSTSGARAGEPIATRTPLPTRTVSPSQTFVAQNASTTRPITPAVVHRLDRAPRPPTNLARRDTVTAAQSGPPVWGNRNRAVSPNERQLWSGSREQSLVLPSQRTARGDLPNRTAPSDIQEPAGAAAPIVRPQPTPQPSRPVRRERAPTETFTPAPKPSVPAVEPIVPRSSAPVQPFTPQQQVPRSGDVFTPRSHIVSPPNVGALSTPLPPVHAPVSSSWGRSIDNFRSVPASPGVSRGFGGAAPSEPAAGHSPSWGAAGGHRGGRF